MEQLPVSEPAAEDAVSEAEGVEDESVHPSFYPFPLQRSDRSGD